MDYKVTDAELTSVANAIRTKGGTQAQLEFPTGFVSAVGAITPSTDTPSTDYSINGERIPTMTSNNSPRGICSASSMVANQLGAFHAFDGVNTSNDMHNGWLAKQNDSAPWIQYTFHTPVECSYIDIYVANNSTTTERTVYIEGLTANDEWENALDEQENVILTFNNNHYGDNCDHYSYDLNGETYKAIRIRGTEPFYGGTGQYACTFDEIQITSYGSGVLPGIGYYGQGSPSQSLGVDGNIYTDTINKIIYKKQSGSWSEI